MQITFRPFTRRDLSALRAWFVDAELARRLSFPTDAWFAHVAASPAARCWAAVEAGMMIATVQVDRDGEGPGYLDLAVRPDRRGQGLGTAMLAAFLAGPGRDYPVLEGRIAPDNAASLACCRRCGFTLLAERDEDGFVRVVYGTLPDV